MDEIHDRIALVISTKGMTNAEFAESIDVQPSNISHIMSGRNKPSLDLVMKVLKRFPELRTEWLLHGKGAMNKDYNLFDSDQLPPAKKQEPLLFKSVSDENKEVVGNKELRTDQSMEPPTVQSLKQEVKDEEPVRYENRQDARKKETKALHFSANGKKLEKIVLFFDDLTFKEYYPSE
ncbi:MAG: helix-turn-helix transcriptional regulator [Bacteroidales bacterium]|nr:helix-turn-helix transcriptional regulator [Bacteroidales bacterium]